MDVAWAELGIILWRRLWERMGKPPAAGSGALAASSNHIITVFAVRRKGGLRISTTAPRSREIFNTGSHKPIESREKVTGKAPSGTG